MLNELKDLGFTPNEVKVYESLLKIGETPVGGILNDLKIHRQIIYNALDTLEKRGMVSKTMKNKIYHFKITDPEIMVENIQKQELIAKRLSQFIKTEMSKTKIDNSIDIYNGREGIRKYFLNMLNGLPFNSTFYIIQSAASAYQQSVGPEFLIKKVEPLRISKNLHSKNIMVEKDREKTKNFFKTPGTKVSLRQIKFLPYKNEINPVITQLWDGHVSFIATEDEPFVIDIKNEKFYNSYLDHFDVLWKMAKK